MYVQSQGTQARIQRELSQRIGTTLHVRRVSVTPWAGLKLSGITIPQMQPGVSGDFLTAKTFRCRVQFSCLFSQPLVIKEISLIDPDVFWAQNADGKWRLPSSPPESLAKISPPKKNEPPLVAATKVEPVAQTSDPSIEKVSETKTSSAIVPSTPVPAETNKPAAFTPEVRRVNLVRGRFRFLDGKLKPVATFDVVDFRSNFRTATDLRGNISIAKTSLRDRFFLEGFQSPVRYDFSGLDFSQITARAGDGEITGHFEIQPQSRDSPFTASIRFRDVQADRIVSEAGGVA